MRSLLIASQLLLLSLFVLSPATAQEDELLPPEQAFALSAWLQGDRVIAEYRIAEGYYLYRKRFKFEVEVSDQPTRLGSIEIPTGEKIVDEFFGEMETYRDSVKIELPLLFDQTKPRRVRLKTVSQGCADIGVCYPPMTQSVNLVLASTSKVTATEWRADDTQVSAQVKAQNKSVNNLLLSFNSTSNSQQSPSLNDLANLGETLGLGDDDDILHPDQAFVLSTKAIANGGIRTHLLLAENVYVYRDKFNFEITRGDGHQLGEVQLPKGKQKFDEFFGDTEVIYDQLEIELPIISTASASETFTLAYEFQGCVEDRICYPPVTKFIEVNHKTGLIQVNAESLNNSSGSLTLAGDDQAPVSEQDQYTQFLQDKGFWLVVGIFFVAGLGLTFTPCVFPMIPILSSIIAGQGKTITTFTAFLLSSSYVLAMALTYAVVGAIAGYFGNEFNIQIWFQDPVTLSIFATIFVLLSLSMFGFYELQIPTAIQSRLSNISNNQKGGTLVGAGLMGFFSAIIVGPCVTAPLIGALAYITQTEDWQLGGMALFALGLGMGTPLMIIGTSAGNLIPRAGVWMEKVKAFFGIVLLAIALWLLERILPISITMALIGALLIGSAIYIGALETLGNSDSGWRRLKKTAGLIILIYGGSYLVGAAAGSKNLVQPLSGLSLSGQSEQSSNHLEFTQIKGLPGMRLAIDQASRQKQGSMLDFYADWCIECKRMEKYAFSDDDVQRALANISTLQADVTEHDAADIELMSSLGIYGPPAILFFDTNGREIRNRRVVGEKSAEDFAAHVRATFD